MNRQGAELLKKFVKRISGAELPIVKSGNAVRKNDVVIGLGDTSSLTEDGFRLKEDNGKLFISSGGDKGALYGVVSLLEDNLGVNYYGDNEYSFQPSKPIVLSDGKRPLRKSCVPLSSEPELRAFRPGLQGIHAIRRTGRRVCRRLLGTHHEQAFAE